MDNQVAFHSFYRIISTEYTQDGYCVIGVQVAGVRAPRRFKLSQYCYSLHWLKHFHKSDLEMLWLLTKQQPDISSVKRVLTFVFIKSLMVRNALLDWEEEAKRYTPGIGRDFDDW